MWMAAFMILCTILLHSQLNSYYTMLDNVLRQRTHLNIVLWAVNDSPAIVLTSDTHEMLQRIVDPNKNITYIVKEPEDPPCVAPSVAESGQGPNSTQTPDPEQPGDLPKIPANWSIFHLERNGSDVMSTGAKEINVLMNGCNDGTCVLQKMVVVEFVVPQNMVTDSELSALDTERSNLAETGILLQPDVQQMPTLVYLKTFLNSVDEEVKDSMLYFGLLATPLVCLLIVSAVRRFFQKQSKQLVKIESQLQHLHNSVDGVMSLMGSSLSEQDNIRHNITKLFQELKHKLGKSVSQIDLFENRLFLRLAEEDRKVLQNIMQQNVLLSEHMSQQVCDVRKAFAELQSQNSVACDLHQKMEEVNTTICETTKKCEDGKRVLAKYLTKVLENLEKLIQATPERTTVTSLLRYFRAVNNGSANIWEHNFFPSQLNSQNGVSKVASAAINNGLDMQELAQSATEMPIDPVRKFKCWVGGRWYICQNRHLTPLYPPYLTKGPAGDAGTDTLGSEGDETGSSCEEGSQRDRCVLDVDCTEGEQPQHQV